MYNLDFEKLVGYDSGEVGISLEVEIGFTDSSVKFPAKIDTGATACIFERKYGEKIGVEIETGDAQRFYTATDSFRAYGHYVTLVVAGFEFYSHVFFAADENFQRSVLGRNGWLDRVVIAVNDYDGKLYLKRYESE